MASGAGALVADNVMWSSPHSKFEAKSAKRAVLGH